MENDRNSVKSHRTSPYLQKPIRSLEEVSAESRRSGTSGRDIGDGDRLDNDSFRVLHQQH